MGILYPTALFILVVTLSNSTRAVRAEPLQSGFSSIAGDRTSAPIAKPHLSRAVELIRKQVGWFGSNPSEYSREFLCAVATMNYVQSRVSPLNYSLLVKNREKLPTDAEGYLSTRAGICGGQVMTARAILDRLGIRNRPVEFYLRADTPDQNQSHIGVEVFYAKQWHFFDITWGTFFRHSSARADDVLSISEVLKTKDVMALAVTNSSDLWYQQWTIAGFDPFEYIKATEKDVIVGRGGIVHLQTVTSAKQGQVYTPTHQPNYVGRNNRSVDSGSLSFRLMGVSKQAAKCKITIVGVAGSGQLVVHAKSGTAKISLSKLKPGNQEFDLAKLTIDDELLITVNSDEVRGIGYVVIKQISVQNTKGNSR